MPNPNHNSIAQAWFKDVFAKGAEKAIDRLVVEDITLHGQGATRTHMGGEPSGTVCAGTAPALTTHSGLSTTSSAMATVVLCGIPAPVPIRGGLYDIPGKGQRSLETGIRIFRIEDGKIKDLWSEMADLQVIMQLGVFPCL